MEMQDRREIEQCPMCNTVLEHIKVKGEDVFGCSLCKVEVNRNEAMIVNEVKCLYCNNWYDINDGHRC